jgi:hypothetical protein
MGRVSTTLVDLRTIAALGGPFRHKQAHGIGELRVGDRRTTELDPHRSGGLFARAGRWTPVHGGLVEQRRGH